MKAIKTSEKSTIMIVDDQPENVKLLIAYLKNSGFRILVAQNGEEVIRRLKKVTPAILLLDGLMPGMDGFETCCRLKEDEAIRNIPVIFMTVLMRLKFPPLVGRVRGGRQKG